MRLPGGASDVEGAEESQARWPSTAGVLTLLVSAALSFCGAALAASPGQTSDFAVPTATSGPQGIAAGPDGAVWFTEFGASKIGEISPVTHAFSEFSTPTAASGPDGIAVGPDGNLWFTELGASKIAEINPVTHAITEFATPTAGSAPVGIAVGPDGNLWFAEFGASRIGEINPRTHATSDFPTPTATSQPLGVVTGPDGNIWFTENLTSRVGEINPATHVTNDFVTPTASSMPDAITAGPDGNLWFTESAAGVSRIGVINPTTHVTNDFPISTPMGPPLEIAPGPDGNLWFTENGVSRVGEINPLTHAPTDFATPTPASSPQGIAPGPDGNLWFTESGVSKIGFVGAGAPAASIATPSVTGPAQPGSQPLCQGQSWSNWGGQQPSLTGYGFDGYQWLRDGRPIVGATSQSYTILDGDVSHQLSCTATVTYPLLQTTTSSTSTAVTVYPSLAASRAVVSTSGDVVSLTLACQGLPSQTCSGTVVLTSHITIQGGKTVAVAASAKPKSATTTAVKVGSGWYAVATGTSSTVSLTLNSIGQKLLDQFYRLPSTVTIAGTMLATRMATFSYRRIRSPISFTWSLTSGYTIAQALTITGLPVKPSVRVICHGRGCPFAKRTISPHGRTLALTLPLGDSRLRPHTTLEVAVTAANQVGEVAIVTIRRGQQPLVSESCLPPGVSRPVACA